MFEVEKEEGKKSYKEAAQGNKNQCTLEITSNVEAKNENKKKRQQISHQPDWTQRVCARARLCTRRVTSERWVKRERRESKKKYDDLNSGQLRSLHLIFLQFTSSLRSHAAFWTRGDSISSSFGFAFFLPFVVHSFAASVYVCVFLCEKRSQNQKYTAHTGAAKTAHTSHWLVRNGKKTTTTKKERKKSAAITRLHTRSIPSSFINLTSTFAAHLPPIRDQKREGLDSAKMHCKHSHTRAHACTACNERERAGCMCWDDITENSRRIESTWLLVASECACRCFCVVIVSCKMKRKRITTALILPECRANEQHDDITHAHTTCRRRVVFILLFTYESRVCELNVNGVLACDERKTTHRVTHTHTRIRNRRGTTCEWK